VATPEDVKKGTACAGGESRDNPVAPFHLWLS
jgi:hypothetical protein